MDKSNFLNELISIVELNDRKEAFLKLVKLYLKSDDTCKKFISDNWNFGKNWIYPKTSQLYSYEDLEAALVYFLIDSSTILDREPLIIFSAIYYSVERFGLNPVEFFRKYASIANSTVSNVLIDFATRDEEDKSLKAFSWTKSLDENNREVLIFH